MSSIRQVLVHYFDADLSRAPLRHAVSVARRHNAALRVCIALDSVASGAYLSPETAALAAQFGAEQGQLLRKAAEAELAQCAPSLATQVEVSLADTQGHLLAASHGADLLILSQPNDEGGLGAGLTTRLLIGSACPILMLPTTVPLDHEVRRALVAWSPKRESARALRDAQPLLQGAVALNVLTLHDGPEAPPGWGDVQAWAQRHKLPATFTQLPMHSEGSLSERIRRGWEPDASVAETLLNHAADQGADLLVCGAYAHSRAWEWVLGGVTRSLLNCTTVPVLFSH